MQKSKQTQRTHSFFKDILGFLLFIFVYLAIASQILGVIITWDYDVKSNLILHKFFFSLIALIAIISHIRASFSNPGYMSYINNVEFCNFYLTTHTKSIERAKILMSNNQTKDILKKISEEDYEDDEESEEDDFEYERKSYISESNREEISTKYGIDFKRCDKCLVVRPPRVHHCSICRGCIMRMDHHCPWINNCVGQFNQKFFILFCVYCFIGCGYSCWISGYFLVYNNFNE